MRRICNSDIRNQRRDLKDNESLQKVLVLVKYEKLIIIINNIANNNNNKVNNVNSYYEF